MPPNNCVVNNWINLIKIKKNYYNSGIEKLIKIFSLNNIQVRPVWYPNHLQAPYKRNQRYKIVKAKKLVESILCLPSSATLKNSQIKKITNILKKYQKTY